MSNMSQYRYTQSNVQDNHKLTQIVDHYQFINIKKKTLIIL